MLVLCNRLVHRQMAGLGGGAGGGGGVLKGGAYGKTCTGYEMASARKDVCCNMHLFNSIPDYHFFTGFAMMREGRLP